MKKNYFKQLFKGLLVCVLTFTTLFSLSGCGNKISDEAKKLYNEKMGYLEVSNKELVEYLKYDKIDESNYHEIKNVSSKIKGFSTKYFYLSTKEQKVWDDTDFGSDREKLVQEGNKMEEDVQKLDNELTLACKMTKDLEEKCDFKKANELLKELHKKYDGKKFKFEKIK